MSSELSARFHGFGRLLDAVQTANISKNDLDRIANVAEAVSLLEAELRSRYSDAIISPEVPTQGGTFALDVQVLGNEAMTERGRGAYNTNNLIIYALAEARLQSEEKFMTPEQIAFRINRVIQTVISSKGTAENLLQPPYFIESKRKGGWRLAKREIQE